MIVDLVNKLVHSTIKKQNYSSSSSVCPTITADESSTSKLSGMKHFAINCSSRSRSAFEEFFLDKLLRVVVPAPGFWNLRMFSLLRLRFSFFALRLQASSSVGTQTLRPTKLGDVINASY